MNKIVIATSNEKKLEEIKWLLSSLPIEIIPQSQLGIKSCEEPFNTFIENALVKARFASKQTNLPVIADDSGLCVESLDGQPGVLSARFAGEERNDEANNDKLLNSLENNSNRRAHYYCSIVFIRNFSSSGRSVNSLCHFILRPLNDVVYFVSNLFNLSFSIKTLSDLIVCFDETFKFFLKTVILVIQISHVFVKCANFSLQLDLIFIHLF